MSERDSFRGVIRGKVIELETEVGLPDGQPVTVSVQPIAPVGVASGDGIRSSAGAWADDDADDLDATLEANRRARQLDRREIDP